MKSSGSRPSSSPSSSPSPSPSRLIDVSNNAPLLLPSPDTTVAEPESERVHNYFLLDVPVTREQLSHYRNAAETARSELAALLVKYECAQAELLNLKSKLISKEVYIEEMKAEIGSYKENDARQSSLLISVQSRLQEIEKESGAFAILKKQADQKAQTILQENLEMKGKISELEAEIRKCLNESEEIQILACKTSREHHEFSAHLCNLFDMGVRGKEEPKELLLAKVGDMCKENAVLKGQIATLKETINLHEVESKANRETITRLVSELSRAQEKSAACSQDVEKLSDDLKINIKAKQSLEKEMRNLEDRLNAVQRAWEASQEELSLMKKCCSEKEEALKSTIREASAAKSLHNAFREQILALLRSNSIAVNLSTEDIVEKVREMCNKEESKNTMVFQLETQIAKLTKTLETQKMLYQEALQRARKTESSSEALHDQLMRLEGELVSGDVIRDTLKLEKQKYLKFLDQLSEKMNLDKMAADIGFDMRLDAVLARVEQLVKLEGDTLIENKIIARNLQRKLKTQKEQFDNKELQLKLLRQKIAQLEEEKHVRTALAVEKDEANLTVRKLQKKLERLQNELVLARETNTELKVKLADTNELKIKMLEQDKTIEDLSKSQENLEKLKAKAERQLTSVKSELHVVERDAKEDKEKAKNMLESVMNELTTLKSALEEVMKRKEQLSNFREVVSHMLGLNIATVTLPDYEITTRLEELIHAHQHHFVPCVCFKDEPLHFLH
nr:PREDICTED: coiled-coil domain-containing protein 170 isoform X1 [Anolis carolinensis]XP_016851372.1 PREDICTED: coiled-coil domain-containing protein 170 isoform X1 [Anolis carolinensis]|eukprot:XP_008114889.1 PREDICTED: coiled-coil domain-containing protein 170 isoform X1 [Anolis carolinensis]